MRSRNPCSCSRNPLQRRWSGVLSRPSPGGSPFARNTQESEHKPPTTTCDRMYTPISEHILHIPYCIESISVDNIVPLLEHIWLILRSVPLNRLYILFQNTKHPILTLITPHYSHSRFNKTESTHCKATRPVCGNVAKHSTVPGGVELLVRLTH